MTALPAFRLAAVAAAAALLSALPPAATADASAPVFLGPTPYLSFADSPFLDGSFDWFHLEDFEDHLFNVPGVTANAGGVTSVVFGPSIHDSVDADDGVIDGSGLDGDSYYTASGPGGIRFTFDPGVLGTLPTHVGLVWTDGGHGASVTFSAFGALGELLFTETRSGFADNANNGGTAEDRFFGVVHAAGVSAIFMSNSSGGMEVDHLQYGSLAPIPEPAAWALLLAGVAALGARVQRRAG